MWDASWVTQIEKEIQVELKVAIVQMESYGQPDVADMFDYVFEKPTWMIQEQRKTLGGDAY